MVVTLPHTDPTTINVLTDVALLVLNILWYQIMSWLTALNLKRDLRKGTRLFSYEHLGSLENLRFGRTKYRYLKKKKLLDDPLKRQFRWQTFVSIVFLLCSVALVLLHVLIDYGLDFKEVTDDVKQIDFDMIGLSRNIEHSEAMSQFREHRESPNFCSKAIHVNKQNCLDVAMNVVYWTQSWSREEVVLAKTLFQSPSVTDLDVFESMEMDYKALNSAGQPCKALGSTIANEFTGDLEFESPDCVLEESHVRSLTIDMRAKMVTNLRLIVVADMITVFNKLGFPIELYYNSYVSAKDKTLDDTTVDVSAISLENVAEETTGGIRINVDSKLQYLEGQQQRLTFTDLSRVLTGESTDPSFSVAFSTLEEERPGTSFCPFLKDPDNTALVAPEDPPLDSRGPLRVIFGGSVCGSFEIILAADDCEDNLTVSGVTVGVQTLRGMVMIDPSSPSECLDQIGERYAEFPTTDGSFYRYMMSFELDIICREAVDGSSRLTCAFGSETFTWTDEAGWIPYDSNNAEAIPVNMRSKISVLRLEVNGGDESEVNEVFEEMDKIFQMHYPELKYFTDEIVTRARLFGAELSLGMTGLMAAVSSQITPTNREIQAPNKFNAAVLRVEYFIGSGTVLLITLLAFFLTVFRQIQENRAFKRLGVRVRVPTTITDWIAAALTQESELDEDGNTFEFTGKRIEHDAKQSSQSYVGFSKFIEPLSSRKFTEKTVASVTEPGSPLRQNTAMSNPTLQTQLMQEKVSKVTFEDLPEIDSDSKEEFSPAEMEHSDLEQGLQEKKMGDQSDAPKE